MPQTADQKLYVVFHGLIPLVEDKTGFHAVLIHMDGHATMAGHWLNETPLSPSGPAPLRLTGVTPGTAGINPALNLVVGLPELDMGGISRNPACFACMDLPKPEKVYSYFSAEVQDGLTGAQKPKSQMYSALQVFEYTVPGGSFDAVSLSQGHNVIWADSSNTDIDGAKISVLHVYNEPAGEESPKHSADEFCKGSRLFGLDVGLKGGNPLRFPNDISPSQSDLPAGLLIQELGPLCKRSVAVRQILDAFRTGAAPEGRPIGGELFCNFMYFVVGMGFFSF